ncbi:unnamed protein product [Alopecurus aequalis]
MDFRLHYLENITNDFEEKKKVGSGGYGTVYKALHDGKEIAVKKLHSLVGLDDKAFDREFRNLSNVHHENVVHLIGYCYESRINYVDYNGEKIKATVKERILCFDYMQGGSLDSHIKDDSCDLDWPTCYKIISGTCEGLNHLHSAHDKPIYHMDLKPSNILLDEKMTAKIADLGLSRIVSSTSTYKQTSASISGSFGYMPPEYINGSAISKKFDVFSLGGIIIRVLDGNFGHSRFLEMGAEQFINYVTENWEKRLPTTSEEDILRVKTCTKTAIRCLEDDRNKRPYIHDIVKELKELEEEIAKMSLYPNHSKDLIGQTCSCSSVLSVDPSQELRFLFEPRTEVSSCLQLTNITQDCVAFSIKTNKKYYTQPNTGVMPPCSNRYIRVTLRAHEEAPPNMQCPDVFVVHSACVSEDFKFTSDEIIDDALKEGKVVDMMKLPIVYVATDQFSSSRT